MAKWQVAAEIDAHAYELLGEVEARSFELACQTLALQSRRFRTYHNPRSATFMGYPLINLGGAFRSGELVQPLEMLG